jgi:hypothetical protein
MRIDYEYLSKILDVFLGRADAGEENQVADE